MNILITGGSGFIGSHLAKHYVDLGNSVYVVDNLITGNFDNISNLNKELLNFFNANICDFDYSVLPKIDIAYHLASPASPVQYFKHPLETLRANSEGTYRLYEFVLKYKCSKVVFASTSEVYGDPLEHPQKESYFGNVNSYGPRSCYDEAKRYAEALSYSYINKYNLDIRIVRIFNTYGPNMELEDGRIISNFITQAISLQPITIYGDGLQTRSFCYVSDLIRGLVAMGETENLKGKVINLGNPEEKSVLDVATLVLKMVGSNSVINNMPSMQDDPKKRKPDISKAQKYLHFDPKISLEEGLKTTIEYFQKSIKKNNLTT